VQIPKGAKGHVKPRWQISYTPGPWVILAGPTSLVALDPDAADQASLADDLWSQVHSEASMGELITRLAAVHRERLPRLVVLFLEQEGVRALLRGQVRILSESGQVVAQGEDVLTWKEVHLADLRRIELDLGAEDAGEAALPLVHGAVHAGRLRLIGAAHADDDKADFDRSADTALTGAPTEVWELPPDATDPAPAPGLSATSPAATDTLSATAPVHSAHDIEEMENADTELIYLPPPAMARLRSPDGSAVDLDRPVLIGRAPSDAGFENAQPHLLTVSSPSQDISRTHVLVAPENGAIVVTDLHSTNGTVVVKPGPDPERVWLPSGQTVTVDVGSVLELGDEVAILIDGAH
jgi:hypothetical protein